MEKISLAIISRNNEATIGKLLESVKGVFDEVVVVDTGSTDKTNAVAAEHGAQVYLFTWCDDFSAARTFSFSKCKNDWVVWLDTDDVVKNAEKIPALVEKFGKDYDGISLPYDYCRDNAGNNTTSQHRLRIVRKSHFQWKARVHEELVPVCGGKRAKCDDVVVIHEFGKRDDKEKLWRNFDLLKLQLKDEGEKQDPRTVYYMGNTLFGLEEYEGALKAYQKYVSMSGWAEELFQAWIKIGIIERHQGRNRESLLAINEAWNIYPHYPDVYLQLGWTFQALEEFEKSNWALEMIGRLPKPEWVTAWNPRDYDIHPLKLMGNNYLELEQYDKALTCFKKALRINPKDDQTREIVDTIEADQREAETVKRWYKQYTKIKADPEAVKRLYQEIPKKYRSYPSVIEIRNSFDIKTTTSGKDVAIMCGIAYEEWSPESTESGIGGSEEAVVNMARELTKIGYNVTVYNTINEAKEFDGVWYKPWWEFNRQDKWDYFIGWRYESIFDHDVNATHAYLWLHDIVNPNEYTPERLARIEKILVLSQMHRQNLPDIPDEKFFVTSNGVDVSLFDQEIERKPFKMIYTSSYDRGLEQLLQMWPKIKAQVPEAELSIYYGWGNFDKRYRDNPERKAWKEYMVQMIENSPGVEELGRIGHMEMAKEMLSSAVWSYPTTWLETNCISALKAQIAGAIPVVINFAALRETVKFGVKVEGDVTTSEVQEEYVKTLVNTLKNQSQFEAQRKQMMEVIRKDYSWEAIAKQWKNELLT